MLTRSKIFTAYIGISIILTGCLPSKIENEINETQKTNAQSAPLTGKKTSNDLNTENIKLSEEQQNALNKLEEKEPKEALFENDLEIRKELDLHVPGKKASFQDPIEFSQYISYLFFAYYAGQIKPKDFNAEISSYAHEEFLNLLPKKEEAKIETFKQLQKMYIGQLRSPIKSYVITEPEYQERAGEAVFYRKFILKNGEEIYSVTVIKKEGDKWTLLDDSPSPPYEVQQPFEK